MTEIPSVAFITTILPPGSVGNGYNVAIIVSGVTPNDAIWGCIGSLPPGLVIGQTSGIISGIPTTPGTFPFKVTVTNDGGLGNNAEATFSIAINPVGELLVTISGNPAALSAGQPLAATIQFVSK